MTSQLGLCYLATPYSKYIHGTESAFVDAAQLAARLLLAGYKPYSPITHTHPIACYGGIDPLDHRMWLEFDEIIMARCDCLLVAHIYGWEESKGIAHEIAFFERAGKPVYDLDPETLAMTLREGKMGISA